MLDRQGRGVDERVSENGVRRPHVPIDNELNGAPGSGGTNSSDSAHVKTAGWSTRA